MITLRTILAATDLSAVARHAAMRAALMATGSEARLSLQHVVSVGAIDSLRQLFSGAQSEVQSRLMDEVRDDLHRLAAELAARHGVAPDLHLSVGPVLAEIAGHADAIDADMLVLGARGAGFMRELLIGSTTERVLRKTYRPLLVVKQMAHEPYRRVLVPVDFSARAVAALQLARMVAPQADIVLLHAFEVPFEGRLRLAGVDDQALTYMRASAKREALVRMGELVAEAGLSEAAVRRLVLHGDASSLILEQEQEQDCDLIVIGKRGLGLVEEMLLGSVTKHVLAQSAGDILVADRAATP
ncbi:MAG: universal stress protein [Proteobacteria bacterium]|nr:universal stress protein [Pseudomonadota bacterium]